MFKPVTKTPTLRKIGFLLIDGFALMSASSAIEPLRAANVLAGRTLYTFRFFSKAGGPASSSCGASFETEPFQTAGHEHDILFVIASGDPLMFDDNTVLGQLRALNARGLALGGISGGSVLLAKAGVMEKRRFTVHWEHYEELRALSDRFLLERRLFVIDRDRYTCAGGVAPLDMMYAIIGFDHGIALADAVADWFIHTGVRSGEDPQRIGYAGSHRQVHQVVLTALELMENHLADPLALSHIAMLSGIGVRQLQRRFDDEFGQSVMKCYMDIRLRKADELIRKTKLPFVEVALATGFINPAHFAKVYRTQYGSTPSNRRKNAGP